MKKWIFGLIVILMAIWTPVFGEEIYKPANHLTGIIGGQSHEAWRLGIFGRVEMPEISAPSGNPPSNYGWFYAKDNGGLTQPYWEDNAGTVTNLISSSATLQNAYDNGETISLDADGDIKLSLTVTARKVEIANTFAGTQAIALQIDAESAQLITDGLAFACTAGTITDAVDASHASIVNAINVGANVIIGLGAQIDFSEFDVAAATGSVTINDDGDLGAFTVEGTVLDINSLTFVGAGEIKTAAGTALTLSADDGATAAEDLIITANNISLTAVGLLTLSPDAALAIAIDASDTDIATALSVGANDIVGTTGLINYTNFDVDAAGAVVCTALNAGSGTIATTGAITATGNITSLGIISGASIAQDAIIAKSAGTTLSLDGTNAGGVAIGTKSGTGAITLGGGGFATLVSLPTTVDLTMAGGQLSITDTANGDLVTLVNNTLTSSDIIDISATGTRTSGGTIKIVDGATTASTIIITASTQTSGKGISYTNAGAGILTGDVIYLAVTDGEGFTGSYLNCFDGAASDFTIKRYGATVIAGNASGTDALTLTNGDILVSAGNIDITTGTLTVGTGSIAIATNGNFSSARGGIQLDTIDDDSSYIKRNQTITGAALFTIEETHTGADFPALVVTQNATGAFDGIDVSYAGSTYSLHDTLTAAAGDGIYFTVPASYTGQLIKSDLLAWLGTSGEGGVIDIVTTAAATQEVGQGIRLNFLGTGTAGTAVTGKALFAHANAGVKAGESLVFLDTLFNTALHIKNDGVSADGILVEAKDAYTGQGIVGDLGAWLGTVNEGFLNITSDAAATIVVGQVVRLTQLGSGQHSTAIDGSVIYAYDDAAAPAAGTSYAVTIKADHIEALHVDVGKAQFDEGIGAGTATDSSYLTDTIEIDSAGVKALKTTKTTLVVSPGADYFIELVSAVLIYDYLTAVYSESADDLVIEYSTSGDDITAAIEMTGYIDQGADMIMTVMPVHPQAANVATDIVNNAIRLVNTGDGEFGGAGEGTMTVKVTYRIHKAGL